MLCFVCGALCVARGMCGCVKVVFVVSGARGFMVSHVVLGCAVNDVCTNP